MGVSSFQQCHIVLLVSLHLRTAITIGDTQFTILNSAVGGHFDLNLKRTFVFPPLHEHPLATNRVAVQANQLAVLTWRQCQMNGVESARYFRIVEWQLVHRTKPKAPSSSDVLDAWRLTSHPIWERVFAWK